MSDTSLGAGLSSSGSPEMAGSATAVSDSAGPNQYPAPSAQASAALLHNTQSKIRRRNRMITSCLECRRRKLKCNKQHPCTNCVRFQRDCLFLAPALDSASQSRLTEIKEKVGSLEALLEKDLSSRAVTQVKEEEDDEGFVMPDDERDLEPTPLALQDAPYGDDAQLELLDLGVQLGKLRLTDRIGGFVRPRIAEEVRFQASI
jgi:Fungal Zn(2)-Cys(6) binuclear cluster domain